MQHHRKRVWIDAFQTRLVIRVVIYSLIYLMALCCVFLIGGLLDASLAALGAESGFLSNILVDAALAILIFIPTVTYDAVRFAHRLVGPLYRFRKTMQAIAAGEPVAPIQLRKDDFLMEMKDDFNTMLRRLAENGYVVLKESESPTPSYQPE